MLTRNQDKNECIKTLQLNELAIQMSKFPVARLVTILHTSPSNATLGQMLRATNSFLGSQTGLEQQRQLDLFCSGSSLVGT